MQSTLKVEESDDAVKRANIRAFSPYENALHLLETMDVEPSIKEHEMMYKELLNNPIKFYQEHNNNLKLNGLSYYYPILKGVIGYLIKSIFQDKNHYSYFKTHKSVELSLLVSKLLGIMIENKVTYPYADTIYIIVNMLEFIDMYLIHTKIFSNWIYYHGFRYRYLLNYFIHDCYQDVILLPTFLDIKIQDFIKISCVPIYIVGVTTSPMYADKYYHTPIDFFFHDIGHSRTLYQEQRNYYDRYYKHKTYYTARGPYDIKNKIDFYNDMYNYTKKTILPIINILPSDSKLDIMKKKIKENIIFEIVHEKSWPITSKSLCRNIISTYDIFPVHYYDITDKVKLSTVQKIDPTTLSNIRGKLRSGFYDDITKEISEYIPHKYRTSQFIATNALELLKQLKCSVIPSLKYLLALTTDRKGAEEFDKITQIKNKNSPINPIKYPKNKPIDFLSEEIQLNILNSKNNKSKSKSKTKTKSKNKSKTKSKNKSKTKTKFVKIT